MKQENIYEMYYSNNKKFNFYVVRYNWETIIAKIINIENINEGDDIDGKSPYYKSQKVIAEFYRADWEDENCILNCNKKTYLNTRELLCPGNFSYFKID